MKQPQPRAPAHQLVYDPTWGRQVLASGGRPLRWRCQSCGQRYPNRKSEDEPCPGPTVVELPSSKLQAATRPRRRS